MRIKSLFIMIGLFLSNGCAWKSQPIPTTIDLERSQACQNELEESVRMLINVQHLTLSKDIFATDAYLYLTNQKGTLLKPSPIYNYPNGRKKLMLYKRGSDFYLGLLDKEDQITKEKKILHCPKITKTNLIFFILQYQLNTLGVPFLG